MDHMKILKRAWAILWSYKALWIFGIILALTAASPSGGGGGGGGGGGASGGQNSQNFQWPNQQDWSQFLNGVDNFFSSAITAQTANAIIGVAIALVCLAIIVGVLFRVLNYVSKTALIRMVAETESTGEKLTWRQGWRRGWSRGAWRLFLIDLVIFLPLIVIFLALFGCAAIPLLLGSLRGGQPGVPAVVATVGMVFLFIFLAIVVGLLIAMLMEIIYRVAVLENLGVFASIRRGWQLLRLNLSAVGLMWLILLGIRIGFGILMIPVVLLLIAIGLLFGGGLGAALYFLVNLSGSAAASWIAAGIVGGGLFVLILSVPLLFLGGLRETYFSTVWTLTYRELPVKELLIEEA